MLKSKYLLTIIVVLISLTLHAQQTVQTASNDSEGWMRSEAKIYVVGAVVLTILIGLILYVVRLDKKISRMERER